MYGPLFYSVYKMTETQCQDMFEAIGGLAERFGVHKENAWMLRATIAD